MTARCADGYRRKVVWVRRRSHTQVLLFIGYGFFKNGVIGNAVLLVYTGAVAGTDNRGRSRVKTHPLPGRLRA